MTALVWSGAANAADALLLVAAVACALVALYAFYENSPILGGTNLALGLLCLAMLAL